MAAKLRKQAWLLAAMLVLFTSTAAFASIPRANTNPPLDRWAILDELAAIPPTPDNTDLDNEILLREAVRTALPPVGIGPILPETHVWAFEVLDEISRPVPDELSRAVRQAYAGLVPRFASDRTVLTPDPMGYQDSSNLYAFAGGDPVNNSDPTGMLCETANASGLFNWVGRCAQDSWWVAGDTANGLFNPVNGIKNTKRALGGVVGLGKLAVKTGVGLGELALDTNPIVMSLDPIGSTQRSLARLQAVGEVVAHPIDAITTAHSEAADRIIAAEQAGNYYAAGAEASEIAAADTLAVLGAAETGLAVAKFARNAITKSTIERIGSRVYDNSVRAESRRMVEIEGRNIWEDSFNSDLGRSAGRRAQLVMQRWARRQSGKFATPNWAFGDIAGSQLRMFPPANPRVNPLVTKPRAFVIPDVYYRPLSFGLDFKLTNYKNLPQDWGYVTYQPLSEIRKVIFNPYAYRR
jgi:hypothetical protein